MTYSRSLGDRCIGLGAQKNTSSFLLSVLFQQKKPVEVAINNFTMRLIISKWLIKQKCGLNRKTMRQKEIKTKEETVYESIFIHLNME